MKLLELPKENTLQLDKQLLALKHEDNKDLLRSTGSKEWQLSFGDPMAGWGMFCEACLLALDKDCFLMHRAYEHSRGGHRDDFMSIISPDGKILAEEHLYGFDVQRFAFNETNKCLYLLYNLDLKKEELLPHADSQTAPEEGKKALDLTGYTGKSLLVWNSLTGKRLATYPVFYPRELLGPEELAEINGFMGLLSWSGIQVNWVEKKGEIGLQLQVSDFARKRMPTLETVFLPLSQLLEK